MTSVIRPLEEANRSRPRRHPLVPLAAALAAGILADRWLAPVSVAWFALAAASIGLWGVCRVCRNERIAAVCLLAACASLGGARHHLFFSVASPDDVARFAGDRATPVRVIGTLTTSPAIRETPRQEEMLLARGAPPRLPRSICTLECDVVGRGSETFPVTGAARLTVTGHLLHAGVGDVVEVRGWMFRPRGPRNPGEFDLAEHVRRRGARCAVHAGYPQAVRRLKTAGGWNILRWIARLRQRADASLHRHLGERTYPLAAAMLLGNRAHMDDDVRDAFAESGMMHILAISGLHVGILAAFVWMACRLIALSDRATAATIILLVVGYALLTEGRASVVRATVIIVLVVLGRTWYRRAPLENALAAAGFFILMINPTDLFDIGAQLSFLAMLGIIWSGRWRSRTPERDPALDTAAAARGPLGRLLATALGRIKDAHLMMAGIWLLTVPLVASRFHIVSPVGFLINVALAPVVFLVLGLGYALLFAGFLLPEIAGVFGTAFDAALGLLRDVVEAASATSFGHLYVPGPPVWWLVGYFGLLGLVICLPDVRSCGLVRTDQRAPPEGWSVGARRQVACYKRRRLLWAGICAWTIVGLSVGLTPKKPDALRCTFLAVGHGVAVLIEMPDGRVLLYDAGSLLDGDSAARTVESALWSRGRSRIDAVIVSHADVDHFNALPRLLDNVPVGSLLIAQSFLDFRQPPVERLCQSAKEHDTPIRLIAAGDRILADANVELRVLHPGVDRSTAFRGPRAGLERPADDRRGAEYDNANSIVLEIAYAGRRILLTGDLEEDGLDALLSQPPRTVRRPSKAGTARRVVGPALEGRPVIDVLMAPHHGSLSANTPELAAWSRPRHVVICGDRYRRRKALTRVYGKTTPVLSTEETGAVVVEITAAGRLRVETPFAVRTGDLTD